VKKALLLAVILIAVVPPTPSRAGHGDCSDDSPPGTKFFTFEARARDSKLDRLILDNPCRWYGTWEYGFKGQRYEERLRIVVAPGASVDWDRAALKARGFDVTSKIKTEGAGAAYTVFSPSPAYDQACPSYVLTANDVLIPYQSPHPKCPFADRSLKGTGIQPCFGEPANFVGTEGNDTIELLPRHDVVVSLGGDDRVHVQRRGPDGLVASEDAVGDVVCTGEGNDNVSGWGDAAKIHGGPGDDDLWGADVIWGSDGNDRIEDSPLIYGGAGDDEIDDSNCRPDEIHGGAGNDRIVGGFEDEPSASDPFPLSETCGHDPNHGPDPDRISGDEGDDKIEGGDGDDRIWGGKGQDRIWGGFGNDRCDGGPGSDEVFACETAK
jgi:hypothetical protein